MPPKLDGKIRRSYVLWKEFFAPFIALKFASGNGSQERDKTPRKSKFWVDEGGIRVPFYGIYEVNKARVEMYRLVGDRYQLMTANSRGHYSIKALGVELGIWEGEYQNQEWPWLRWWDAEGNLLLTSQERADRQAEQLRALGVEPEA